VLLLNKQISQTSNYIINKLKNLQKSWIFSNNEHHKPSKIWFSQKFKKVKKKDF